jgi:peptidoglycan/LPS O-acetylase OafA/YrhL
MSHGTGLTSAPKHREIELDFIRGIAILMVIDFHSPGHPIVLAAFTALGWKPFGWAGVDIFFVLSGFLVGGLLIKEWKLFGKIDPKRFLIRRGFKIWPQYYFFILFGLLIGHRELKDQWGNLLNLQNYMGGIAHTWTLAVEEHAYLLLAIILWAAARRGARPRQVFLLISILAAAVLANRFILSALSVNTFTRTDTRVDGILYGVLLAMLYHFSFRRFAALQTLRTLWICVISVTLLFLRFTTLNAFTASLVEFLSDMSGVAVLLLFYRPQHNLRRSGVYRLVASIGLYSYGIYLWHVSVLGPIIKVSTKMPALAATLWLTLAPYVFGILIGVILTRLVEFPTLILRDRLFPRRVDSAVGIPAEIESRQGISGEPESVSSTSA